MESTDVVSGARPATRRRDAQQRVCGMAHVFFDRMFVLLPAQATTNYSVRGLLPQLIQDIVMVQAFSEAQKSNLLASFYPGELAVMVLSLPILSHP